MHLLRRCLLTVGALFLLAWLPVPGLGQPRIAEAATVTVSGNICTDTTWTADNVYELTSDVTICPGTILTISPGVVVKFATGVGLLVEGVLKAQGTSGSPIFFTSLKDDTVGGDTNGDGTATTPSAGDWSFIVFYQVTSDDVLNYATVRYGGGGGTVIRPGWSAYECSYSPCGAVRFDGASPIVTNSTITNNLIGLYISGGTPNLNNNNIYGNSNYGVYNAGGSTGLVVSAQNSWWGDPTGPYDPSDDRATGGLYNPFGKGDAVSDGVNYSPWVGGVSNLHQMYLPYVLQSP